MFEHHIYSNRRNKLKNLVDNGVIVMLGNGEAPMNYADNTYRYRQDSTFLYFFGLDFLGVDAVIDVDNGSDILFADDADINTVIWTGAQEPIRQKAIKVGVADVRPYGSLATFLGDCVAKGRHVHFTPPYRGETVLRLANLLSISPNAVAQAASLKLIKACIELRSVKEPCEIAEIEAQMAIGYQMHVTAMRMAQPGMRESQIAAAVEAVALADGAISFPIICSVRGETLHNHIHVNTLKKGDLLLVDAGCESPLHYATDHTRTSPVGGVFTSMQKDIYQVVLNANNAVADAVRPGIPNVDLHFIAARQITSGLMQLGLMKGNVDEAVSAGAHTLFFPHGIGHMMGLDVHDMEAYDDTLVGYDEEFGRSTEFGLRSLRLGRRLQPGFVITNEPGIYFIPQLIDLWKGQGKCAQFINYDKLTLFIGFGGIRLEDDILVTETGGRLLGQRIPITIDEVEKTVQSGQ